MGRATTARNSSLGRILWSRAMIMRVAAKVLRRAGGGEPNPKHASWQAMCYRGLRGKRLGQELFMGRAPSPLFQFLHSVRAPKGQQAQAVEPPVCFRPSV